MNKKRKKAIIIGAGPAGLTAAYELLKKTDIQPIVFEAEGLVGGIAKTVNCRGNRIDIGGHRFFSKSDKVMEWWQKILPPQTAPAKDEIILKKEKIGLEKTLGTGRVADPEKADRVMLIRNRLSRIFFLRKFFDYPVSLSFNTIKNLGFVRMAKIFFSYLKIKLFPIKDEKTLEDFFINRFGKELYLTFFKDYTEKVWGLSCQELSADWGAQRVRGLSLTKTVLHIVRKILVSPSSISQKQLETSLIERFLYPKLGPGQLWEEVARLIEEGGGKIYKNHSVVGVLNNKDKITALRVKNNQTGEMLEFEGDYLFSSMPLKGFILAMGSEVPEGVIEIARGLSYRDFITVGLLLKELKIKNQTLQKTINNIVPDTWMYIQERDVKINRLQIFNNWSPYMVKDLNTVWIGLEYCCNEGDDFWNKSDEELTKFGIGELAKIGIIDKESVIDSAVLKTLKAYPVYVGSYYKIGEIRKFLDRFENLFLIGRNGMHRYNNMDHSMLTAMAAVQNIIDGIKTKDNIWSVNAEEEYHEEKNRRHPSIGHGYEARFVRR